LTTILYINRFVLLFYSSFFSLIFYLTVRLPSEFTAYATRFPVTTLLVTHNLEEAIGLVDRLLFLSASPARILAEVPVAHPRTARSPEALAALREEIARRINQAYL
jgi:NitT/TauT family transport system ATP-binding protein